MFIRSAVFSLMIALIVGGCFWSDNPMVKACEAVLAKRLKAPSTYKRISITETIDPIPFKEYLDGSANSPDVRRLLERMGGDAFRFRVIIEYDAANAFGTPIRGFADCTYEDTGRDAAKKASEFSVKIDGKTHTDYLVEGLKAGSR